MEIFRAFGEKVWGEFFKKAFSMSRENIRRKLLGWRPFFSKDLKFWAKFFSYLRKKFRSFINTAFYISRGAFSDFWKFKFFSGFWTKTFRLFVSNLFGMVVKTLFHVSGKTFWGKWTGSKKKCFRIFFCSLSGCVSDFWFYFSRHGFQKCILHVQNKISRRSLCRITLFAETFEFFSQFFSGFRWKKHKQCCQNCGLRVQMTIFGFENFFQTM